MRFRLRVERRLYNRLERVLDRLELVALLGIIGEDGNAEDAPSFACQGTSILEDECRHASLVDDLISSAQTRLPLSRSGAFDGRVLRLSHVSKVSPRPGAGQRLRLIGNHLIGCPDQSVQRALPIPTHVKGNAGRVEFVSPVGDLVMGNRVAPLA